MLTEKVRAIVVDDERYAREELVYLLTEQLHVNVVAEASSGEEAIVQAVQHEPDVLFLDVSMGKMGGIETAEAIQALKNPPQIVFATAYAQYAVDAFRVQATDYLLKPYNIEELTRAISKVKSKMTPVESKRALHKLAIENDGEIKYISISHILYAFREEQSTMIVTLHDTYEVKMSLKQLEERLEAYPFFRIHKSYLVNLNEVTKLTPWFNGAFQLEVNGRSEQLPVSRNYVKQLKERLAL